MSTDDKTGIDWPLMQAELTSYFGDPRGSDFKGYLKTIDLSEFGIPVLPRLYGNWVLEDPLRKALEQIATRGLGAYIHTYDGCFNIRAMKSNSGHLSVHSWGLAIDLNASENPFGSQLITTWPDEFVQCWLDAGFEWGGAWNSVHDAMHFQLPWTRVWGMERYAAHVWIPAAITVEVEVPVPEAPVEAVPPVEIPAPPKPWWLRLLEAIFGRM